MDRDSRDKFAADLRRQEVISPDWRKVRLTEPCWQPHFERQALSIGVQSGPPIGAQKGPLCGYEDPLMLSACFALLAA